MHISQEKKQRVIVFYAHTFLVIILGVAPLNMQAVPHFFDNFFSATTWYEKGLSSTIGAWNKMRLFMSSTHEESAYKELDIIIGKCAFARFCLEKMISNKQQLLEEDVTYFNGLLHTIDRWMSDYDYDMSPMKDHLDCMRSLISVMTEQLHIPRDI